MRHIRSWAESVVLFTLFGIAAASSAQDLQLPSDYTIDLQLASATRARIMGTNTEITGTAANQAGDKVFHQLISNLSQAYPWKLTLVNNQVVNAHSTAGGQVYVDGGLLALVGQNKGLWAAVLSHEVAHTARRHQVMLYLRELYNERMVQYYRARVLAGDKSANWALLGFRVAAPIALKKMERDQEHDADQQGMLLMARAGYHPDYVFALHHLLLMNGGERSRIGTFFLSDHPRWETRDQRSDKVYADALAEFDRAWPDAPASPGGRPPVIAFLGQPEATENKKAGRADISIPLYCRNANAPLDVLLAFEKDNHPVKSADAGLANKDGNLIVREKAECFDRNDNVPVVLHVASTAVTDHDRSTKAMVMIGDGAAVLAASKLFDVHFPKLKK